MSATWTTKDGKILEIAWMNSVHLVHSLNMVIRAKKRVPLEHPLHLEAKARHHGGSFNFSNGQFNVPVRRESPKQLCLLRALLDTKGPSSVSREILNDYVRQFRNNPTKFFDTFDSDLSPLHRMIYVQYAANLLTHG